ncbi:hypothetical protein [Streptomyces sp. AM6-12]|uniref:hypothetical protein n=1 Tax=Streptomyces sp. AM6-12 TaxID=3345149 RepID=UPI0037AB245F
MNASTRRPRAWAPPPSPDPTQAEPGIRISAAPIYRNHDDRARWMLEPASRPTAACACRCGYTGRATGTERVAALVTEYAEHRAACW